MTAAAPAEAPYCAGDRCEDCTPDEECCEATCGCCPRVDEHDHCRLAPGSEEDSKYCDQHGEGWLYDRSPEAERGCTSCCAVPDLAPSDPPPRRRTDMQIDHASSDTVHITMTAEEAEAVRDDLGQIWASKVSTAGDQLHSLLESVTTGGDE